MTMLCDIGASIRAFLSQLTALVGFDVLLAISLAIEVFFVILFAVKILFSYEMRLRRGIDKANAWLFKNKKVDQTNIKDFTHVIKKGPRRLVYFWQQYILFREHEPSAYLTADNLIEKPLKTSSFSSSIKNLSIITVIWSLVTLLLGISSQSSGTTLRTDELIVALIMPILILFIGFVAVMILKARKTSNLDEIYHIYHIFARFIDNACVDLPPYVDFDLLFTAKEIEKGNPQLREYYEARARKAKEEFEKAKQSDVEYVEYNFKEAGVDGSLVLERAMKESETFMNKKANTLAKIAHVEAQQEALKRNYENVQKDLQRKIQASKENIQKLIQQQEATTNRMEVGFLRKQQEQEISKQESLQNEYDQEETRFAVSNEELEQEISKLEGQLDEAKDNVERAMVSEYQSFYEKIMNGAYEAAEERVTAEKNQLKAERDLADRELTVVQTQVKRLIDENQTLRARLGEEQTDEQVAEAPKGQYDQNGNYVYEDGSYHDPNGLFHDVDGKIYDKNGTLIAVPEDVNQQKEEQTQEETQTPNFVLQPEAKVEEVSAQELGLEPESVQPKQVEKQNLAPAIVPEAMPIVLVESQQPEQPKRKRGRPRKPVFEDQAPKAPRKRGRPRKDEATSTPKVIIISEKDGVPEPQPKEKPVDEKPRAKKVAATKDKPAKKAPTKKKATAEKPTTKKQPAKTQKKTTKTQPKKTETAKKSTAKAANKAENKTTKKSSAKTTTPKKTQTTQTRKPRAKRATPKKENVEQKQEKNDIDLVNLAKINKLITAEEERLSQMKALVNSEITDALSSNQEKDFQDQRQELLEEVEKLKAKAEQARAEGRSEQELSLINSRLEALIKEMTDMNNK